MSRAGEVWDNSAMEGFFSSLMTESKTRKIYLSHEQADAYMFDYMKRFDNPSRRHSTLAYGSSQEFEKSRDGLTLVYWTNSGLTPRRVQTPRD